MTGRFESTIWTVVHSAGDRRETACGELLDIYRPPIVRYLASRGVDPETAEDLAQETFLRLFQKDLLDRIDQSRGKFRSFLLGVANNILREHRERQGAARRGGRTVTVPLDAVSFDVPAGEEQEFSREWMLHLVRLAVGRINRSATAAVKRDLEMFLAMLRERPSTEDLASRFKVTATTVKNGVQGTKQRIRQEVARLVTMYAYSEAEFAGEMKAFEEEGLKPGAISTA